MAPGGMAPGGGGGMALTAAAAGGGAGAGAMPGGAPSVTFSLMS